MNYLCTFCVLNCAFFLKESWEAEGTCWAGFFAHFVACGSLSVGLWALKRYMKDAKQ